LTAGRKAVRRPEGSCENRVGGTGEDLQKGFRGTERSMFKFVVVKVGGERGESPAPAREKRKGRVRPKKENGGWECKDRSNRENGLREAKKETENTVVKWVQKTCR